MSSEQEWTSRKINFGDDKNKQLQKAYYNMFIILSPYHNESCCMFNMFSPLEIFH